ncbi:MAG: hypothetical protein CM1200mP18_18290 [Gammaproteobacteria bacterium]|nr:MAG: hypothetical protein CM1200mP18_18290 [Gammaproteobacteria bacterium]
MNIGKLADGTGERDMWRNRVKGTPAFLTIVFHRSTPARTRVHNHHVDGYSKLEGCCIDRPYLALLKFKNRIGCETSW